MELLRALAALSEAPRPEHRALAELLELPGVPEPAEHTDVFTFQVYPYASVYLGCDGMIGGDARARIADFFRVVGVDVPKEPDQLSFLLASYARFHELELDEADEARARFWSDARRTLLHDHLCAWLPVWLDKIETVGSRFYAAWARLLRMALDEELDSIGPPADVSAHLRAVEPVAATESRDELLAGLLAPARCGLLLVRDDLRRAADEVGLVARIGERRYVLAQLLEQDARAAIEWLACEAERAVERYGGIFDGVHAAFWHERATATRIELRRLLNRE